MNTSQVHTDRRRAEHQRRLTAAVLGIQERIQSHPYGADLPTTRDLARDLRQRESHIRMGLKALEERGVLVLRHMRAFRLAPGELHPDDVTLDHEVRQRIRSGEYAPGSALPTGILADRHGLDTPEKVGRACRRLIADGLVCHCHGPFGPGLYVASCGWAPRSPAGL
ncbi:hypothetical protein ACFXGT_27730 [Streptomyces sp. NPDC059352]|uniref:hypothetical protein n=1 Tax=Streptomyces sp. NPDC059352 TaxID=3346810 RepID=UPI0036C54FE0